MPHDKDGRELAVGDVVHVPARIESLTGGEEYCNASILTEEVMYPGAHRSSLTLNTRQVIKAIFPPAAAGVLVLLCHAVLGIGGLARVVHAGDLRASERGVELRDLKMQEQERHEHERVQAIESREHESHSLYVVHREACAACAVRSQQFVPERVRLGERAMVGSRAIVGKPLRGAGRIAKGAASKVRAIAGRPARAATKALGKAGAWLFRRCTR